MRYKDSMRFVFRTVFVCVFLAVGVYVFTNVLPYKFSPQRDLTPDSLVSEYDFDVEKGEFHGRLTKSLVVNKPEAPARVLGSSYGEKRIEVDLTNQRVYAFEGDRKIYDFVISSGKWGRTPTGNFRIWIKLRYTKMEGGSKALRTYYYLPNVPYVMFFANEQIPKQRGFGLHGTYWHNNFGNPMSHGCINMKTEDAGTLYYWTQPDLGDRNSIVASEDNPGTPVIIYGVAPMT